MLSKQELRTKYLGDVISAGFVMEAFGIYDRPEDEELGYLQSAHASVVQSWKDIHNSMDRIGRNYAVTPGERLKMIADVAKKRMESALTVADVSLERGARQQMNVAARIDTLVRPPTPHQADICKEIRGHLLSRPEAERYDLLATARGDDAVLLWHAVASAPAFLSGVVEGKRRDCRVNLIGLREPKLLMQEGGLDHGVTTLKRAAERLTVLVTDHIDFDTAAELRALDDEP